MQAGTVVGEDQGGWCGENVGEGALSVTSTLTYSVGILLGQLTAVWFYWVLRTCTSP